MDILVANVHSVEESMEMAKESARDTFCWRHEYGEGFSECKVNKVTADVLSMALRPAELDENGRSGAGAFKAGATLEFIPGLCLG